MVALVVVIRYVVAHALPDVDRDVRMDVVQIVLVIVMAVVLQGALAVVINIAIHIVRTHVEMHALADVQQLALTYAKTVVTDALELVKVDVDHRHHLLTVEVDARVVHHHVRHHVMEAVKKDAIQDVKEPQNQQRADLVVDRRHLRNILVVVALLKRRRKNKWSDYIWQKLRVVDVKQFVNLHVLAYVQEVAQVHQRRKAIS